MAVTRGTQKFDRLTITLVPTADEGSYRNVPSTFNVVKRTYAWRQLAELSYMIVPRRISNSEIKVDIFLDPQKRGKTPPAALHRLVHAFIQEKVQSEWKGLKLGGISRAAAATPPVQASNRGTIEEILGVEIQG